MGAYRLSEHIHFCQIGDQRVFLDLIGDRYFCLPSASDAAFTLLAGEPEGMRADASDIDFLLRAGIVVPAPQGRRIAPTGHPRPSRSLVEEYGIEGALSFRALVEAWLLVMKSRRAVAKKQLPRRLAALASGRVAGGAVTAARRDHAARQFRAVRRFIPIAPNCLYDSLALHRFLQRRGIAADLVIGAKLHPFGAHCWLQDGDAVLNDSLAAIRDFEPVLVA